MAKILEQEGLVLNEEGYKLFKKSAKAGETIPKHNHPKRDIIFTVVKGEVQAFIDDQEFRLTPGKVLYFDGNSHISANIIQDSEIFITLIKKTQ